MNQIVDIRKDKYDQYIGRANKHYNLSQSIWANPFVIGKDGNREEVVEKYRLWINCQPDLLLRLPELKDKILGCWCDYPTENCHGSVLIELANSKNIKNWFSNMLPFETPLIHRGISYKTSENFYQACKLPKDRLDLRKEIAEMNAFKAKVSIGDKEKYKWREDWNRDTIGIQAMEFALKHKFAKGTNWHRKLMITKELDLELIEWATWDDKFWSKNLYSKQGENNLGKILMRIRNAI